MWFETSLSSGRLLDWIDQGLERNIAFAPSKRLVTSLEPSLQAELLDIYDSARMGMTRFASDSRFWALVDPLSGCSE